MTTIIWNAGEKMIPGVGLAKTGEPMDMPDNLAKSFVAQGKAKHAETVGKSTKPKVMEGKQ